MRRYVITIKDVLALDGIPNVLEEVGMLRDISALLMKLSNQSFKQTISASALERMKIFKDHIDGLKNIFKALNLMIAGPILEKNILVSTLFFDAETKSDAEIKKAECESLIDDNFKIYLGSAMEGRRLSETFLMHGLRNQLRKDLILPKDVKKKDKRVIEFPKHKKKEKMVLLLENRS